MNALAFIMAVFVGFWLVMVSCSPTIVEQKELPPFNVEPTTTITARP